MNMRTRSAYLRVLVLFPLLLGAAVGVRAQENCCLRKVWTAPFTLPPGDAANWSDQFAIAFDDAFYQVLPHTKCPVIVEFSEEPINHDYRFVGEVTTEGLAQIGHDGNLRGTFVARVRLIDPDHGDAILKEARLSWTGMLKEGLSHQVSQYEPSTNSLNPSSVNPMGELSKQFLDIDALIYDYERKPQKCRVTLTGEDKDVVDAGKTVTVTVSNIIDHEGRPPQPWQRIVIHPDKGKLLNCTRRSQNPDDCVFEAGSGTFEFTYQAPDDCKISTDTLTVYNSCEKRGNSHPLSDTAPEDTIATKTFDIRCDSWNFTITLTHDSTHVTKTSGAISQCLRTYSMTLKGRVHFVKRSSKQDKFESDAVNIELKDSYQRHSDYAILRPAPDEKLHAVWIGEKSGQVPLKVTLTIIHIQPAWYRISWTHLGGDPVHYKGGFQWEGVPQTSDGSAEFTYDTPEVIQTTLPPKEVCQYKDGQTVLQGEFSTHDLLFLVEFLNSQIVRPDDLQWGRVPPFLAKALAAGEFILSRDPIVTGHAAIKWEFRRGQ